MSTERVTPTAIEAEQSILGAMMLDNRLVDSALDVITASDFYRKDHQTIFGAIQQICDKGGMADVVTVSDSLSDSNIDLSYLGDLVRNTPNIGNLAGYTKIVRERAIQRALIHKSNEIVSAVYAPEGKTTLDLVDFAERSIMEVSGKTADKSQEPKFINSILEGVVDEVEERFNAKGEVFGLETGFKDLDHKTGGLSGGDLVIVAGRPSMGKTSFAMNVVERCALAGGKRVQVFSMEMPAKQLGMRLLASVGRVSMQRLKNGGVAEDDWPKLTNAIGLMEDKSIQIDDTPAQTISGVRSSARRMASKTGGVDLIMLDYLQLMNDSSGNNRTEQLSNITRGLKALANEMDCPVIVLSQLNRSLEQRPNKRPVMSDLRESGAIEQDADIILFIYRDEVYNPETDQKGTAEIIIGKQRNGPLGTVRLAWLGELTRFENFTSVQSYQR